MTTKTTSKVKYEIAVSTDEYAPDGWFSPESDRRGFHFYSYEPYREIGGGFLEQVREEGRDLREAVIEWADGRYGPEAYTKNGSYKLLETTHTVTIVDEKSEDESLQSKTESTHSIVFYKSYRTPEQMEKFYLAPLREWEAKAPEREAMFARMDAEYAEMRAAEEAARLAREEEERLAAEAALSPFARFAKRLTGSKQ